MGDIKLYASFTEEDRKNGYNGQTEHERIPEEQMVPGQLPWTDGRNVILTADRPFIHNDVPGQLFWVAEITISYDLVYADSDEFGVPFGTLHRDAQAEHEGAFYGSYIEIEDFADAEVKWLTARWDGDPYVAWVDGQEVDNWPHGEL